MVTRRVRVRSRDVVFLKGIVEAGEGLGLGAGPAVPMRGLRILGGASDGVRSVGVHDDGTPLGVVVRRDELDAALWRRALTEGACGVEGEAVRALERRPAGWRVTT